MSTDVAARKFGALEAAGMFAVIMAYIWKFRFTHPKLWLPAVGMIVVSQIARYNEPALGFRSGDFKECVRRFGPIVLGLALALLGGGLYFGTMRPIGFEASLGVFAMYLPWGFFQQYLLNGYFLKRFDASLSQNVATLVTSFLFSVVHSPNWFLMAVTLVGGFLAVWIFRRHKDLYFLGIAHAILGSLLFLAIPDSLSHHLNIGPGYHQ